MTLWLDTSALVSLYVPKARSARVARLVRRAGEPIPFSQLHELELANALRLRVFRRTPHASVAARSICFTWRLR